MRWRMPSSEIIAGYQYAPLILASVSRAWCHIATKYPPLWSTILIDQSESDYLERIHLFLDRSGQEFLDVILIDHTIPSLHLNNFLVEYEDRFKTVVGLAANLRFNDYSFRMESYKTPASFVNWSVYAPIPRRISTVPIPKCLRHFQLHQSRFDSTSLIQFTYFNSLESLSISIAPGPNHTEWDQMLRFERLRHLNLDISNAEWPKGSSSKRLWIEWLECPALADLDLVHRSSQCPSNEVHIRLEACLLRFRSLQNLRVHAGCKIIAGEDQKTQPSIFDGRVLELVQLTVDIYPTPHKACVGAFTERLFSVFVPNKHLTRPYGQFRSPTIFANVKTMHIQSFMKEIGSVLVAPQMSQLEFPLLEELYLQRSAPKFLDRLRAPRLRSLRIDGFTPSDLRQHSNTSISIVRLTFRVFQPGSQGIYLPSVDKLRLDIEAHDLFHLNVHPSLV